MSFHSRAVCVAAAAMVAGLVACAGQGRSRDAAATPADPVPTVSGSTYRFQVGETTFAADGPTGRVTGLAFRGRNLLIGPEVNGILYGSTFWTSPQTWPWPPAVDAAKWTHRIDAASRQVVFDSGEVLVGNHPISVEKRFSGDVARDAVVAEYRVTNRGTTVLRFAPWQVTRVASAGLVFHPRGAADPAGQTRRGAPRPITAVSVRDGIVWYDFSGSDGQAKSVSDAAEGWLARVADGVLLLQTFVDIPPGAEAEGEGEIEIYSAPNDTLVELEPQGAAVDLAPGATSRPWRVYWHLRPVPEGMDAGVGSKALVDWVRAQLR